VRRARCRPDQHRADRAACRGGEGDRVPALVVEGGAARAVRRGGAGRPADRHGSRPTLAGAPGGDRGAAATVGRGARRSPLPGALGAVARGRPRPPRSARRLPRAPPASTAGARERRCGARRRTACWTGMPTSTC
jgi:hypothetical protein